ncbi:translational GTPase TypA [Legionella taurinensis]|uniref:Large ribosomal subunit assembly factor BipA n=1 Tax=Legionella taurinensis TaxID=70611 RepID=A0A3A5LKK5_9GAMM|nr:translational GTPase TypA [Legionella taurinensis]MDX1835966.1 translational GTPase TypA [Legionella taurinensis]PUT38679.1 translational GTPase TypA [Legionella taurinensis]PUT40058.1 translational GTPase TypA [Legionella taurinensis]PUT42210.1 translational GTPase TypA [Legionella taurinensis]PUT45982.1 translational GTPase TypA [Legionella taurinensis]
MIERIRNIAIIAHVDHGKTTLVDKLLQQTGTLNERAPKVERLMDSNALEKERGITILAKNTSVHWRDHQINIVDTPGHADFGGEVERILSMVDSVLLLVDAVDGPMPQTRFVTQKAFARGLNPIVVINKIDRPGARPHWVMDQVFDLFDNLGANDTQLDFPVVYASALNGYAKLDLDDEASDMNALLQTIIDRVSPPDVDENGPFQMQISSLDYSSYVGTIGIGRITRGRIKSKSPVKVIDKDGNVRSGRILQLLGFKGLERVEVEDASAGDIVAITGIEQLNISDTLCDPNQVEALPALTVDEPTISMTFQINDSPFAGQEGKFITSRKVRERLQTELLHNVALRVEDTEDPDKFRVSGRGELHLSILIENMRREGYELAISKPEVIMREENGEQLEPYERLTVDVEETHQGAIMEKLGERRGEMQNMIPDGKGRVRLDYMIPTRGLIGFHTEFLSSTSGTGLMYHVYDHYGPAHRGRLGQRVNGVLIANCNGAARAFALFNLQERGRLFIEPQTMCYEGMLVGIHSRDNDLVVNVTKEKQLTNIRASGSDENIILTPPIKLSLEQALEFIDDDELVEVTPQSIRLRKKALKEHERKRASRASTEE